MFINNNLNISQKIQNKAKLTEKDIAILDNSGEGKFFYKVISKFYYDIEKYLLYPKI